MGFIEKLMNLEFAAFGITQRSGKRRYVIRRPLQRRRAAIGKERLIADQEGDACRHHEYALT
jgi:hypothetical protein